MTEGAHVGCADALDYVTYVHSPSSLPPCGEDPESDKLRLVAL